MGGEEGCRRLAKSFYGRVGKDPALRRLFPGKSLRCATEAFAAFLIQFLGGDEKQTQQRWFLSLRESHSRFRIEPGEQAAWITHMRATLRQARLDDNTCVALDDFFTQTAGYTAAQEPACPRHAELSERWNVQTRLDRWIASIEQGREEEVLRDAAAFASRPSVFVGLLARMMRSRREMWTRYVMDAIEMQPSLRESRHFGRSVMHYACASGCTPVVERLLRLGMDPNQQDRGGHAPLYFVANECASETGPDVVRALAAAGADVNAATGAMRTTALHMAARRGHVEIARALLQCGASMRITDRNGVTPLQRALRCRRAAVAALLQQAEAEHSL
jgi:hemoglobin